MDLVLSRMATAWNYTETLRDKFNRKLYIHREFVEAAWMAGTALGPAAEWELGRRNGGGAVSQSDIRTNRCRQTRRSWRDGV